MDDDLTTELLGLELGLARRELGPAEAAAVIDGGFVEVRASGRRWDRTALLALLASPRSATIGIEDFEVSRLAVDAALATYRTIEPDREVLRVSIWVGDGDRWRLRYHQGTPAAGLPGEEER